MEHQQCQIWKLSVNLKFLFHFQIQTFVMFRYDINFNFHKILYTIPVIKSYLE